MIIHVVKSVGKLLMEMNGDHKKGTIAGRLACFLAMVTSGLFLVSCQPVSPEPGIPVIRRQNWWNYYHRGVAYSLKGDWNRAVADFQVALGMRSGAIYPELEEKRRVKTYGLHFLNDYFPHRELGICYYHQGQFEGAEMELLQSLEMLPTSRAKQYLNMVRQARLSQIPAPVPRPIEFQLDPTDDLQWTNQPFLAIKGKVRGEYYINGISINDKRQFIEMAAQDYELDCTVPLASGKKVVTITASDLLGNEASWRKEVVVDLRGPTVSFRPFKSAPGSSVEIFVSDDFALGEVTVEGQAVSIPAASDRVIAELKLEPDRNVQITAIDKVGNKTVVTGKTKELLKVSTTTPTKEIDHRRDRASLPVKMGGVQDTEKGSLPKLAADLVNPVDVSLSAKDPTPSFPQSGYIPPDAVVSSDDVVTTPQLVALAESKASATSPLSDVSIPVLLSAPKPAIEERGATSAILVSSSEPPNVTNNNLNAAGVSVAQSTPSESAAPTTNASPSNADTMGPRVRFFPDLGDKTVVTTELYLLDLEVSDNGYIDSVRFGLNDRQETLSLREQSPVKQRMTQALELQPGANTLIVTVRDFAGNETQRTVTIERKMDYTWREDLRVTAQILPPAQAPDVKVNRSDLYSRLLNSLLRNPKRLNIIERDPEIMQRLLMELQLGESKLSDQVQAVRAGKLKTSDWLLQEYINVWSGEENWDLVINVVDVNTSEFVLTTDIHFTGYNTDHVEFQLTGLVDKLHQQLPTVSSPVAGKLAKGVKVPLGKINNIVPGMKFVFFSSQEPEIDFADPIMYQNQWIQGTAKLVKDETCLIEITPPEALAAINVNDLVVIR